LAIDATVASLPWPVPSVPPPPVDTPPADQVTIETPRSEPMTVTAPAADSAEAASVAPAAAPALDLATDAAHAAPAYIAPEAVAPAMHDPLVNAMPEPLAAPANEEAAGDLPASAVTVPVRASAPLSALAVGVDERAAAVEPLLPPIEESPAGEPAAASDEWLDVTPGDQTKATGADEYPGAVPISEDARGGELRAAHDTVVATPDLQMLQAPEAGEQLDHAAQRPDLLAERDTPGESPVSSDALDAAPPLSVLSTGEVPDSDNVESAAEAHDVGHSAANAPAYPVTDEVPPMLANDAPSLAHASALPPATAVATEEAAVFAARPPTNTTVPLEQAEQDPGAEELLAATPPEGALATPSASAPETLESDPTDVAATATPTPEPQAVDAPTIGLAAQSSAVLAAHPELSAGSGTEDDEFILVVEPEVHTPPRPRDTTMARSLKARRRRVLSADGEAEDPVESSGSWPAS
ncbi:MAG TPA: hypothetical protein VGN32_12170, partial [Ktedonobacterales bacterium]|nr:hypothetical protein [Ktedonobacterales bacterium]